MTDRYQITGQADTWTRRPDSIEPAAYCTRCAAAANDKDVASGFCWRCGYLGAVEFKEADGTPR